MKFICRAQIEIRPYMMNAEFKEVFHIINAENENEAIEKLHNHYTSKNKEYYISYWVNKYEIYEEIL